MGIKSKSPEAKTKKYECDECGKLLEWKQSWIMLVSRRVSKDEVEECRLVFRLGLHL